jgi:hypothetical protein
MEKCNCEGHCAWSCGKALHCKSRFMREYADIIDEDELDDEEVENDEG